MQTVFSIAALLGAFCVAGCNSKPRDMRIVGTWEGTRQEAFNVDLTIQYCDDGSLRARASVLGSASAGTGNYEFLDERTISQELTFNGRTVKEKQVLRFENGAMTQTDEHGNTVKYRKIR